jgi:hypothetical protein
LDGLACDARRLVFRRIDAGYRLVIAWASVFKTILLHCYWFAGGRGEANSNVARGVAL